MREFFSGWRRKVGCVTLVMACGFVGAWIKSRSTVDLIHLNWKRSNVAIISGGESLRYTVGRRFQFLQTATLNGNSVRLIDDERPITGSSLVETHCWPGAALFVQNSASDTSERFAVPYWTITLPLTLLSAYLILWKPRKQV
ncbi:MAG: hypothetical protein JWP89_4146 [Schlesneria sp.]|nr:hypothetical protein [Schlesneria sp.]